MGKVKSTSTAAESQLLICNEVQTFQEQFAVSSDQNSEIKVDFKKIVLILYLFLVEAPGTTGQLCGSSVHLKRRKHNYLVMDTLQRALYSFAMRYKHFMGVSFQPPLVKYIF